MSLFISVGIRPKFRCQCLECVTDIVSEEVSSCVRVCAKEKNQ